MILADNYLKSPGIIAGVIPITCLGEEKVQ